VTERDRLLLNAEMLTAMIWTGTVAVLRARLNDALADGAT
jgi:hypothetical protein